jgi:hypothetical protein
MKNVIVLPSIRTVESMGLIHLPNFLVKVLIDN